MLIFTEMHQICFLKATCFTTAFLFLIGLQFYDFRICDSFLYIFV